MRYAGPIERLIKSFSGLPGVGEKTATRFALFILNSKQGYVEELAASLLSVKEKVSLCTSCMAFSEMNPCRVCSDASRDRATVCVVSDFRDLMALERAGGYGGRYHVLHGSLSPLKGVGPDDIRIKELVSKVEGNSVKEVILATGFDPEGETTATYLARVLKLFGVKVSRIATGVPMGSYVEYMDSATLGRAIEGRRIL
jgi:recombination protein RecR